MIYSRFAAQPMDAQAVRWLDSPGLRKDDTPAFRIGPGRSVALVFQSELLSRRSFHLSVKTKVPYPTPNNFFPNESQGCEHNLEAQASLIESSTSSANGTER